MVNPKKKKEIKEIFKCGMVSIVGRPNVGKSTLLNNILGEKVAIVSKVPQTTRTQIRGILNDKRGQIIFIDTPGVHMGRDRLDQYMNKASIATVDDADCIVYLVDTTRRIGREEEMVANNLKDVKAPVILGLNKVDMKSGDIPSYISFWEQIKGKPVSKQKNFTMIALSGLQEINTDKLVNIIFDYLPEGPALYPTDTISDVPKRMAISDIIREKLFRTMREEVPHSIAVVIENLSPMPKKRLMIKAAIVVERDTQKEIVIGKGGKVLKLIGTQARKELEELLEKKIFLDLFVKVEKNWRDKISVLQDLGYNSFE